MFFSSFGFSRVRAQMFCQTNRFRKRISTDMQLILPTSAARRFALPVWQANRKKKHALIPHFNGEVIAPKLEFEIVLIISCSWRLLTRNLAREHALHASVFLPIPSCFHSVHFCTDSFMRVFYVLPRLLWCSKASIHRFNVNFFYIS